MSLGSSRDEVKGKGLRNPLKSRELLLCARTTLVKKGCLSVIAKEIQTSYKYCKQSHMQGRI